MVHTDGKNKTGIMDERLGKLEAYMDVPALEPVMKIVREVGGDSQKRIANLVKVYEDGCELAEKAGLDAEKFVMQRQALAFIIEDILGIRHEPSHYECFASRRDDGFAYLIIAIVAWGRKDPKTGEPNFFTTVLARVAEDGTGEFFWEGNWIEKSKFIAE